MKKLVIGAIVLVSLSFPTAIFAIDNGVSGVPGANPTSPTQPAATHTSTPAPSAPATPAEPPKERTWGEFFCDNIAGKNVCSFFSMATVYWLFGVLAWLFYRVSIAFFAYSAWWLDGAVYYLVLRMGEFVNSGEANGVRLAWVVIRDLCNIFIIGGFIAVGISTIINISQYASDKFLSRLIIAALLINFSYFFVAAIIDGTNFISTKILESNIVKRSCAGVEGVEIDVSKSSTGSIFFAPAAALAGGHEGVCSFGASFAIKTKLHTWDTIECLARSHSGEQKCGTRADGSYIAATPPGDILTSTEGVKNNENFYWELFLITFMAGIFIMSAAFVFISAAFLLIARFVVLIVLLVTSPFGIAAINVPYIEGYAGKWWELFLPQAFFAPVFFILLGISFNVIDGMTNILKTEAAKYGNATGSVTTGVVDGNLALFITFFVAMAFMWVSLIAARSIASSAQELKGIYDFASKQASRTFWAPKNTLFGMTNPFAFGLRTLADKAAAESKPGTWQRFITLGIAGGLRGLSRVGADKNRYDSKKSAFVETQEEMERRREEMLGPKRDKKIEGGYYFGIPYRGKPGDRGEDGKLTKEAKKARNDYWDSQGTPAEIRDRLGLKEFNRRRDDGEFSEKFLEEVRKSKDFDASQKQAFTKGYMESRGFTYGMQGKGAADAFEELTEIERNILLAERGELRQQKEFLGFLKSDTFDATIKNASPADQKRARDARQESLHGQLTNTAGTPAERSARAKDAVGRMSNNERAKMSPEAARAALPHMSAAQVRHLHANTTNEGVRKEIEKHDTAKNYIKGTYVGEE